MTAAPERDETVEADSGVASGTGAEFSGAPWIVVPHHNGDVVVDWGILWWWPLIRNATGFPSPAPDHRDGKPSSER